MYLFPKNIKLSFLLYNGPTIKGARVAMATIYYYSIMTNWKLNWNQCCGSGPFFDQFRIRQNKYTKNFGCEKCLILFFLEVCKKGSVTRIVANLVFHIKRAHFGPGYNDFNGFSYWGVFVESYAIKGLRVAWRSPKSESAVCDTVRSRFKNTWEKSESALYERTGS